jgi:bifunctional DNA-binding transcriptional regulator/antitoxin component of YhaV-PrlF toxin-antitoxin module
MSTTEAPSTARRVYRVEVGEEGDLTLPRELSRDLGVQTGDLVEFQLNGEQAILTRAEGSPQSSLRGLLSDYFTDRDDVKRFIDEERSGWAGDEESTQG